MILKRFLTFVADLNQVGAVNSTDEVYLRVGNTDAVTSIDALATSTPFTSRYSSGASLTMEQVLDNLATALVAGANMTITPNDGADTITFTATGGGGGDVDSVNGAVGTVVLDADDIDDTATTNKFATETQLDLVDALDDDLATFTVPANTTISAAAAPVLGQATVELMRSAMGLGTISTNNYDDVVISGGSISGVTLTSLGAPVAVVDGGTGGATAAAARSNLGIIKRETFSYEGTLAAGAGTKRLYFARAATIVNVLASVDVAGTGTGNIVVDVMKNGTTVFTGGTGRPTLAAAAYSDISNTPAVTAVAAGDYLTVDIISVTATTPGQGLTVAIEYLDA